MIYNEQMIKNAYLLLIPFCAIVLYLIFQVQPVDNTAHTHLHAGFTVYVDGVKQDFSNYKYMNFTPCTDHNETKGKDDEQIEKAHLHDGVGDVVHVHGEGALWSDLFKNIQFEVPPDKSITAYRQGAKIDNILSSPVDPKDSVLIIIGSEEGIDKSAYVTQDHIEEVESASELCGSSE